MLTREQATGLSEELDDAPFDEFFAGEDYDEFREEYGVDDPDLDRLAAAYRRASAVLKLHLRAAGVRAPRPIEA